MNNEWNTDEAIKRWDKYAEEMGMSYTEEGDLNRRFLLNPAFNELIGEIRNKKVLDAGCGEGYLSRLLAQRGAEVLGIDYSKNMVEVAIKKTPKGMGIKFNHGNCENLQFLDDYSFDLIVCNMVLHDLANYKDAIKEMYRLLVKDGIFVFSILHPCFDTPESGWIKNDKGEKQFWKVNRYFQEGAYEQRSSSENKLLWFHRTLSSYFNALIEAGFYVESIVEPKPSDEAIEFHPDFKNFHNMCHFLVFKARK